MKAVIKIQSKKFEIDFSKGIDISIPLDFNGDQPNTYEVPKATSEAYKDKQFIGDTREGGACNFETYTLTPHCNGTHTECIGHITHDRINIISSLQDFMIPATVVSINPSNNSESYIPEIEQNDMLITKETLKEALKCCSKDFLEGLIIRTLPNPHNKKSRNYIKEPSPFFSLEAMKYIYSLGIKHLLVDTPSVDRLFDDGFLSAHNIFWNTVDNLSNLETQNKTITEMIFVNNDIIDGSYFLNLQIAPFVTDASPSRPILFKINEL
ncbi:MAG: cyclase family protein [Bacteroidota bacterium]|nr:cyclase family protein [Bacteroidota bacterium]